MDTLPTEHARTVAKQNVNDFWCRLSAQQPLVLHVARHLLPRIEILELSFYSMQYELVLEVQFQFSTQNPRDFSIYFMYSKTPQELKNTKVYGQFIRFLVKQPILFGNSDSEEIFTYLQTILHYGGYSMPHIKSYSIERLLLLYDTVQERYPAIFNVGYEFKNAEQHCRYMITLLKDIAFEHRNEQNESSVYKIDFS